VVHAVKTQASSFLFSHPFYRDPDAERRIQYTSEGPGPFLTIRTSRFATPLKRSSPATVDDLIDPHEQDASPKEKEREGYGR
jgi:hypothetical protein